MLHSALPPFAAWSGPRQARTVIVGEAWGQGEDQTRKPFSAVSGKELWLMLGEAWPEVAPAEHSRVTDLHKFDLAWTRSREPWLAEASVAFTNVLNFRPPDNKIKALCLPKKALPADYPMPDIAKGLYLDPQYLQELDRLEAELTEANPNLVIAMGNTACWALLQATNISQIRGTIRQGQIGKLSLKVLPTYHPAALFYENVWRWRVIIVSDLIKALRESTSREISRPNRRILFDPTLIEIEAFIRQMIVSPPARLSIDTETSLGMIDTISLAPSLDEAISCQIGPHRLRRGQRYITVWPERNGKKVANYWTLEEEKIFWRLISVALKSEIPKLFQNGIYDYQYLLRTGLRPQATPDDDDSMLMHHALFPEMEKSLGFLGSIYTNEPAWKLMRTR